MTTPSRTPLPRRRFLSLLAAVGGAGATSACGIDSLTGGFGQRSTDSDPNVLTHWSILGGVKAEAEQEIIRRFESANPGIRVDRQVVGANYDDLGQKLGASLRAGRAPDVAMLSEVWWTRLYLARGILPVDEMLAGAQVDTADYVPSLYADYAFAGRHWAVPYLRSIPVFYYNSAVLAAAGLPRRGPATWDELRSWSGAIRQRLPERGQAYGLGPQATLLSWILQAMTMEYGGRLSTPDFTMTLTDPGVVTALTTMRDQVRGPGAFAAVSASDVGTDFLAGLVGSMVSTSAALTSLVAGSTFPVGVAPLPEGLRFGCPTGGSGLAVPATVPEAKRGLVGRYLAFLTSPASTALLARGNGVLPVRTSSVGQPDLVAAVEKYPQLQTVIDALPRTSSQDLARVFVPGGDSIIGTAVAAVLQNGQDPITELTETNVQLQRIVDSDVRPKLTQR